MPVEKTLDNSDAVLRAINDLSRRRVLVGIPREKNVRPDEPIGNATIGYIQEVGSPARNIPARPHLVPGVQAAIPEVIERFKGAARAAMKGNEGAIDLYLGQAGTIAVSKVKATIRSNIPPPLQPQTILNRTAGRARRIREATKQAGGKRVWTGLTKGEQRAIRLALAEEEIAGKGNFQQAIALIDTAQYINAITWVIRKS